MRNKKKSLSFLTAAILLGFSSLLYTSLANAQPVTFSYRAPDAKRVFVKTSSNYWSRFHALKRSRSGLWSAMLDIPPGSLEFIFIVDGHWRINPLFSRISDGFGGYNNIIIVR